MRKRLILILSLAIMVQITCAQNSFDLSVPNGFPEKVSSDVLSLLGQSSRKKWNLETGTRTFNAGILLQLADNPRFKTRESYRFESNGDNRITISSSSQEGLVFGLYKYLRTLGYAFYLPDNLYTIIPDVTNFFGSKRDEFDQPFAQVRSFFGTGGFGSGNADPDMSVQKDWELWKLRNGFGSSYELAGHRGEDFILSNKSTLQKHPEWLATPLGSSPDPATKLNYLNKDAVSFFVNWTLHPLFEPTFRRPPASHSYFLSAEPSDGGGYINDLAQNAGRKLPSISDQVYGAANAAAQLLDKAFPDNPNIGVNLYAYSTHAAPPSFKLHPRVFVQLVPYRFQNIAFGPAFIKLWSSKASRFGIYDYFKYPDAQFDLPGGLTLEETMQRLIQSITNHSEGTTFETSYSKFSTGIPLWVMGRYLNDGDAHWQKNLQLVSENLFGNASEPIRKLFSLFYNESSFSASHLAYAVELIQQADKLASDPLVKKRLNEIKMYMQYVHLVYESKNNNNQSLKDNLLPVAEFAWKIYETKIIHSYRIMQLVSYSFLNVPRTEPLYNQYQQLHLDWFPESPRANTAWNKISQSVPEPDINKSFSLMAGKYKKTITNSNYDLREVKQALGNRYKPRRTFVISGDYMARGYFSVLTDKPTQIKLKFRLTSPGDPAATISFQDKNYSAASAFPLTQKSGEIKFTLPAGENNVFVNSSNQTAYVVEVKLDDGLVYFEGSPRGLMSFLKSFDPPYESSYAPEIYPSYVYVPVNMDVIEYRNQLNTLKLTAPSGKIYTPSLLTTENTGFEIRRITIPKEETGKIWKAVIGGNYNYNFTNIPDRYFLLEQKN